MNKSKVLTNANAIRKECGGSLSEAFTKSWKAARIAEEMKKGIVTFEFTKVNGEHRVANGTLDNRLFSYERRTDRKPYAGILVYYDVDKDNFRSAKISKIC